ncbi:unnamed protein product [Fraxinus pennsylvanica]|uniref:Uncharacterized protein n=1 Tax=Fraxinus pennsylvanica TaxID=56036 RepID=A0AAD2E5L9_9LAMI|nr:unnamed protein product [Fraxinus pennsylvanica]
MGRTGQSRHHLRRTSPELLACPLDNTSDARVILPHGQEGDTGDAKAIEDVLGISQTNPSSSCTGKKLHFVRLEVLAWVDKIRNLKRRNDEKEKALQLSKIFKEQDNINEGESDDEAAPQHNIGVLF